MSGKTFDKFQQQAIDARKNSVVSAGAGSGKTTVLSHRFLSLVTDDSKKGKDKINADEILALTFTKKATVEMSSRIYSVLKSLAPDQAKLFYKASIKTFDSYCASIARTGAHYYGITPEFTQDNEAIKAFMTNRAIPFILKNRDNDAIKALVSTKNYADIAKELFIDPILKNSTVAEPLDFQKSFERQVDEIVKKTAEEIKITGELLSNLYSAERAFDGSPTKTFIEFQENLATEIPHISGVSKEDVLNGNCEMLKQYILAVSKVTKKLPSGKGTEEIKEWCNKIREHVPANLNTNYSKLVSFANFISGVQYTQKLLPLLEEFQDEVNDFKRSSGLLTFSDISSLALKTLLEHPEIRQVEKEKFKAIMIDEFQDNNSMQRDILFLLAEKLGRKEKSVPSVEELCPDKLFFVGDEKQSIYIFRGADVSVFRSLSKDFSDGNLSMSINYRSVPALIAGFNTIFGGISYPPQRFFPKNAQLQTGNPPAAFYTEADEKKSEKKVPDYEAVYHEVFLQKKDEDKILASDEKAKQKLFEPHIHFALYNSEEENKNSKEYLSSNECEAEWIAEKIEDLTTNGLHGKIYKPGEIAILFRTYTPQQLFEKTLLAHGIPYTTEVVKGFFSDGPVNDIFALLTLCLYENDTLSYAKVLCSPLVNLSFEEMNAVILLDQKPFELSESEKGILSAESLKRFEAMGIFFGKLKEETKTASISNLITRIWYEAGYRYETLWNKKVQMYAKNYDLLFELARDAEQKSWSLAEFLDEIAKYKADSEKLDGLDIPIEQGDGVHLLSIHKSKGLEYPVVFVCNTNSPPKNDSNAAPVYFSKDFGITVNTPPLPELGEKSKNYFYILASKENALKSSAEYRRLLYVALTRAETELFITNNAYKQDDSALEKYAPGGTNNVRALFSIIEPAVNFYLQEENKQFSPFDFEEIPQRQRTTSSKSEKRPNTQSGKADLISQIEEEKLYENAEKIKKDVLEPKYALPSKIYGEKENEHGNLNKQLIAKYNRIDEIIDATRQKKADGQPEQEEPEPRFSYADFGTVVHAYLESAITNEPPKYSNSVISGIERKDDLKALEEICTEIKNQFMRTNIGKRALESVWHKAEYSFKSRSDAFDGKIVKGTVDLVFKESDGTYTIVDYKSGAKFAPETYYPQLSCYRQAIAQMLGIKDLSKIKCVLYYLRYEKEVLIPDDQI